MTVTTDGAYDWNDAGDAPRSTPPPPLLHDETLRDGLQSPSVTDPSLDVKVELLHLLSEMGVQSVNVGLPGAGPRTYASSLRLCQEIAAARLPLRAGCAGRTVIADIAPMADLSQKSGVPIDAMVFIGSSPIRRFVEGWSIELIRDRTVEAIEFAVKEGLTVTYVTEDTTRTPPKALEVLFDAAIDAGAARLCICDTVGHSTPDGAHQVVAWTRRFVEARGVDVGIDWHGHNDRNFALFNTLSAWRAGADRLHGCVLGVGERAGNASLEMLMRNLALDGVVPMPDDAKVARACALVARHMSIPFPWDHPLASAIAAAA